MRRFWFGLISLGSAAGTAFAGCGDVPEQPTGPTSSSTTGGGNTPGTGGTGGTTSTGGADGGTPCTVASDCPTPPDCMASTCAAGVCGMTSVPAGMAATTQVAGDCKQNLCDGSGAVSTTTDDADLPDDGTLCTANLCMNGSPVFSPVGQGVACVDHGGKVCDGAGKCVGCLGAADCPSGVCAANVCVLLNGCDPTTAVDATGLATATVAFGGALGSAYSPACVKVSVGTHVTFNGDFATHPLQGGVVAGATATPAATGPLATPTSAGTTATFTMATAGSYGFYCTNHWPGGMVGAIFVQ